MGDLLSKSNPQDEFVDLFDTQSDTFNFRSIVDRAQDLLQKPGVNVNGESSKPRRWTALQMALLHRGYGVFNEETATRRHEACLWLLQQGARPDGIAYTQMLFDAMHLSVTQLLQMLLSKGCNIDNPKAYFLWSVAYVRNQIIDYHENIALLFSEIDKSLADGSFQPCFPPFDAAFRYALLCGYDFVSGYCLSLNCDPDMEIVYDPYSIFDLIHSHQFLTRLDPLSLAIGAKSTAMIKILLHLGCRVRKEHREKAAGGVVDSDTLVRMFKPHSLQTQCLKTIRRTLRHRGPPGQWLEKAVCSLLLPDVVKQKLMLSDLKDLVHNNHMILHGETYYFGFDHLRIRPSKK